MKIDVTAKAGGETYEHSSTSPNREGAQGKQTMNHQVLQAVTALVNQINGNPEGALIEEVVVTVVE